MDDWLTTILIALPLGAALLVWLLPWSGRAAGSFAVLAALAEVGVWINAVTRFDFDGPLQFEQRREWFGDLGVSYHVGMYGFSLWLVGMSVVVLAAAIAYAFWAGRERPRAYFGLMLFLTAAVVGVFVAQDLLVFYRPASWVARAGHRFVEQPLIAGSIRGLSVGARVLSGRTTEVQTGLVRTYVLTLGSGAALLALVFLAVKAG